MSLLNRRVGRRKCGVNLPQPNVKLRGARAADNVGCVPPQIPLSKSLKTKRLQSVADWDAI